MARKASVRYWESRGGFFCWHKGKQVLLAMGPDDRFDGPTYRAAREKFKEIFFPRPEGPTVQEVFAKYLAWVASHRKTETARCYRETCKAVMEGIGQKPVAHLLPYDVDDWCQREAAKRQWSDSTIRLNLTLIESCFRWAKKQGHIPTNPIPDLEKPPAVSRGLECVLTQDQERRAIEGARSTLRDFLIALRDTGARPGEVCKAEAKHYDRKLNAIVYEGKRRRGETGHKTERTGKARVILLGGEATGLVQRLCQKYPHGPLFRTPNRPSKGPNKGQSSGWTSTALANAFARLRQRTGLEILMPYSFRHTFAVRWLRAGKPIEPLAELLGTSIQMIQRHYGHLGDQIDYLRRLRDGFDASSAG